MQRMGGLHRAETLINGVAVVISMQHAPIPCTVWARPATGDGLTISYSCDGGTTYETWPSGVVATYTTDVLEAPITHLKGQRASGSGTTSTFGVC